MSPSLDAILTHSSPSAHEYVISKTSTVKSVTISSQSPGAKSFDFEARTIPSRVTFVMPTTEATQTQIVPSGSVLPTHPAPAHAIFGIFILHQIFMLHKTTAPSFESEIKQSVSEAIPIEIPKSNELPESAVIMPKSSELTQPALTLSSELTQPAVFTKPKSTLRGFSFLDPGFGSQVTRFDLYLSKYLPNQQ